MSKTYHNLRAMHCQQYNVDESGAKIPGSLYDRTILYNSDRISMETLKKLVLLGELETSPDVLIIDNESAIMLSDLPKEERP